MLPIVFLTVLLLGQAISDSPALDVIAESNFKFSRDFFKSIASVEGNLVTSPLSAHLVLAMTQLGAAGNTASVMAAALHLPPNKTTLTQGFKQLISTLHEENSTGISLKIANRIYLRKDIVVKSEFVNSVKETFDSEPQSVDFSDSNTRVNINQWVEDVTQDKIKNLIEDGVLDSKTGLVLVNAVYFYGIWANKFNPSSTYNRKFYTSETNAIRVPFMNKEGSFKYADLTNLNCKIVTLPYEGNKLSLVILLPNSRTGLSDLENKMSTEDLSALINSARPTDIKLFMPKFKIETTLDLQEPLTKMGMGEMFESSANFSQISSDVRLKIKISKAVQKTIIEVAENGTEAASATYFAVQAIRPSPVFRLPELEIEHPFLFYLVRVTSASKHIVLFSGKVVTPQ